MSRGTKIPLYQANVPPDWISLLLESELDTKKPIAEFHIQGIRVTIHTFPYENQRIPPILQVERWKGQLKELDPASIKIESVTQGGFTGLVFEGEGKDEQMMAWVLQLAADYDSLLQIRPSDQIKRADITIKAVGPKFSIEQRTEIIHFVRSFELIDELPSLR
ncbi:MAG: hypothetical protein LW832_09855 [Parachlamydia sp.]|nr:hypothetical protein [Parachlamydia sp.]